jgi:hypothetical protein
MIELVPASLKHVGPIATRMRAADVEEVGAMGRTPKQALRLGLRASVDCMTVLIDGRPEAMLGLTPKNLLEGEGMAWMLGPRRFTAMRGRGCISHRKCFSSGAIQRAASSV